MEQHARLHSGTDVVIDREHRRMTTALFVISFAPAHLQFTIVEVDVRQVAETAFNADAGEEDVVFLAEQFAHRLFRPRVDRVHDRYATTRGLFESLEPEI